MKDEYVIINKTAIQKRIEELEQKRIELINNFDLVTDSIYKGRQEALNELLYQSTPLTPEIEKAAEAGFHKGYNVGYNDASTSINHCQLYSQLKLDI